MTTFGHALVDAPPFEPLPGGLFSAATVQPVGDIHEQLGVEYEGVSCTPADYRNPCFAAYGLLASAGAGLVVNLTIMGGNQAGTYTVDWGDGNVTGAASAPTVNHNYAAACLTPPCSYTVHVTQPSTGYDESINITVPMTTTVQSSKPKHLLDGIPVVTGIPFATYSLFRCRLVGGQDIQAMADEVLKRGEERAVEAAVQRHVLSEPTTVVLTTAPVSDVDALALLEQYMATHYGGTPIIHMPRQVGTSLAAKQAIGMGATGLFTAQGARVASGAYLGTDVNEITPAAGTAWIYATGALVLRQGHAIASGVTPDLAHNEGTALAERPWVVTNDCVVAAAQVKLGFCCPDAQVAQPIPQSTAFANLEGGAQDMTGPETWNQPTGTLRHLEVTVVTGTALIDGEAVTAPDSVSWDADDQESLDPPTVEVQNPSDRAVVTWTVLP